MNTDEIIEAHKSRLLAKLSDLRNNDRLFDFTIFVGDRKFRVHKLVLASCCDYFDRMFSQSYQEVDENTVYIQNVDANAMESIIDFCYTFRLDLNNENIQEILLAASMLQVRAVEEICVQFQQDHIDASNCLSVAQISERLQLTELKERATYYCREHFVSVINEREFLDIDEKTLESIISDDHLNVDDETVVLQAVIKWYEEDIEERKKHLYDMMKEVRFVLMDPAMLIDLTTKEPIQSSQECKDLVDKAKDYLLLNSQPTLQKQFAEHLNTRPRVGADQQRIFVVGGWHEEFKAIATGEVYDPKLDTWSSIPSMIRGRCGVGLASLNGSLYAVAGHDGSSNLSTVEKFSVDRFRWHNNVANMKHARTSVGVVSLSDRIYAIGGEIDRRTGATDRVEVYDPASDKWSECKPMGQRRLGAGVAVHNNFIYVMGGSGGATSNMYNSVERYDPRKDTWTNVSPMKIARKHLGGCTCRGKIYAIGGRNEFGEVDSAEVYDPFDDSWNEIRPMQKRRSGLGLVASMGYVYAIGGQGGDETFKDVEAYDPETDTWTWKRSMQNGRLGGGMTLSTMKSK